MKNHCLFGFSVAPSSSSSFSDVVFFGSSRTCFSLSRTSGFSSSVDCKGLVRLCFVFSIGGCTPQLHDIDALAKMVDPALKGLYPVKSLSRFADVIALCVQPEPEFRPPMSEVVQALVVLVQRANMSKRTVGVDPSQRSGGVDTTNDYM